MADAPRIRKPSPCPLPQGEGSGARTFTVAASRLAGLAGALLGWRPDEFWRATPAELAAVLEALMPEPDAAVSTADLARLMEMYPDG